MSGFLGSLFGKPAKAAAPAPRATTANDSIMNMKNTQEMLKKKQAVLEAKIDTEAQNAKRLAALMKTNPRKKNGVYHSLTTPCLLSLRRREEGEDRAVGKMLQTSVTCRPVLSLMSIRSVEEGGGMQHQLHH